MKLKQILEDIFIKNKNLAFDYNTKSPTNVSSKLGKHGKEKFQPYMTKSKDLLGGTIYTAYSTANIKHNRNDIVTPIYMAIKSQSDINVSEKDINHFITRASILLVRFLKKNENIDTILVIKSSSDLNVKFSNEIRKRLGYAKFIPDSIFKGDVKNIKIIGNPTEKQIIQINNLLKKFKASNKFISKKIHKSLRSKFSNYMQIQSNLSSDLTGKSILVVDDILTTRSTFIDTFRQLSIYNPKKMIGITLFK
jgi:hypothetical protein